MKNKFFYLAITTALLLNDFRSFAQPGGGDEGDDPPPAPINQKVIFLIIAGILFSFWMYQRRRKLKTT